MKTYLLSFFTALIISLILTPLAILIAPKIGAMDVPKDARRVHNRPIPRFGGLAIFCGTIASLAFYAPKDAQIRGLIIGASLIFLLGVVDDIKGISPKIKLLGQIICALVLWLNTVRITGIANIFNSEAYIVFPTWLSILITTLWIVGITNTINLIDGLDGLAAGVTFIACLSIAYTSNMTGRSETTLMILGLAGATLGFLFFNFHPAKIFMGDCGSLLLGYLLASVSLIGVSPTKSTTFFATIIPVMILALPIFDTLFAIIRRVANHKPIMQADKGHLHHRILAMGFGQTRTVLCLYAISAIMGIAGILWTAKMKFEAILLGGIAALLVFIFLGVGLSENKHGEAAAKADETPAQVKEVSEQ